jgi:HYR domain-containing protein
MKRTIPWALLTIVALIGVSVEFSQSVSSSSLSSHPFITRQASAKAPNLNPFFATTFDVDRTDDTAAVAARACTGAANDCSLRGAIIAANGAAGATPIIINLQPATTYNLTLTNATQENAALTGDLDITTTLHPVTIIGGGSSGPNKTIIDASGLQSGTSHDRAFQITGSGVTVTFQDLVISNGLATDDGTSGASTNPTAQNANRAGGGILNNGGSVTLTNVKIQSCEALGKGDTVINDHTTLDALGGGLASVTGTGNVVITGSTFTGDTALGGNGANFNNGAGSWAKGGSIYFEGGTLSIGNTSILSSNATGGNGGDGPGNQQNGGFGGSAFGGGVYVGGGTVTVNNATLENCFATGGTSGTGQNGSEPGGDTGGGGLYSSGNTAVTNSTFDSDSATGGNAGPAFGPDCFGGHEGGDGGAARGGAILADGGTLIVDTATFASNSAHGGNGGNGGQTNGGCGFHGNGGLAHGGAITNNNTATLNIKHSTISSNDAHGGNTGVNQGGASKPPRLVAEGTGGGIRVGPGTVTIENTIISGNTAANGLGDTTGAPTPGPDVDGTVTSNGHNLLGNASEAIGFTGTGDQTGVNPMLSALADNGGPTRTMALNPGSPAIDAGVAAGATTDQRGMLRTYDDPGTVNAATSDATDIGAFELQPICTLTCPTDISDGNDTDQCGAVVTYTAPSGDACGTVTCDHLSGSFFSVGDTTVKCTSSVGPTCSFKVTVNDTQKPAITAPPNASYQCAGEVPAADPSQATASDNCGTPTVTVSETNNGGAGTIASPLVITRTFTATDAATNAASASQTITVIDNTPPSISCPGNITVNAISGTCAAPASFTATATDNCSVPTVTTDHLSGSSFPVGTTTVHATAIDAAGNSSTCSFTVTVKDIDPPVITLNGQTITLWPPDHKSTTIYVTDLVASASDLCDPGVNINSVVIASVTSDELENSSGDGNTINDIVIADGCKSVQLRAERMGGGNGRVYTITFKVTDSSGNSTTATAEVTVPSSQNGSPAIDDGPHYTVNGCS